MTSYILFHTSGTLPRPTRIYRRIVLIRNMNKLPSHNGKLKLIIMAVASVPVPD